MPDFWPLPKCSGFVHLMPPGAPVLAVIAVGNDSATLQWTEQPGASAYGVYMGTAAGEENPSPVLVVEGEENVTGEIQGLSGDTTYYFVVRAYGTTTGYGLKSNEVSVMPTSTPAWAGNNSGISPVSSTTVGNTVDVRAVPAGAISPNSAVRVIFRGNVQGINGQKFIKIFADGDASQAFTFTIPQGFGAGVGGSTGDVEMEFLLLANGGGINVCYTRSRLDTEDYYSPGVYTNPAACSGRSLTSFNPTSTGFNLKVQAWVGSASDTINADSVNVVPVPAFTSGA